ncbi:hypothetical protein V6N13_041653 [Hibiscus sabdariffa]
MVLNARFPLKDLGYLEYFFGIEVKSCVVELGIPLSDVIKLWCDNTSAVAMATNPVLHTKTKYVDLDIHFVRERVAVNNLQVNYAVVEDKIADVLTKALSITRFQTLRLKLGVLEFLEDKS